MVCTHSAFLHSTHLWLVLLKQHKNRSQNKLYVYLYICCVCLHRNIGLLVHMYSSIDFDGFLKWQKLHSSERIQEHHFQKYFTQIVNSQSSRCSMKLHVVVMPQRGLFQGFGTQRPDRKKKHGPDSSSEPPRRRGGGAVARSIQCHGLFLGSN